MGREGTPKLTFGNPVNVLPIRSERAVEKVVHSKVLDPLYAEGCAGI